MTKLLLAAVAFIGANLDDILLLTVFFSQVGRGYTVWQIVAGQYLGVTALVALSLPGYFGGTLVPARWIGLLGLIPIAMGIRQLFRISTGTDDSDSDAETPLLDDGHRTGGAEDRPADRTGSCLSAMLTPQVYAVAGVTIADGSEEIGIFVPFFATCNRRELLQTLAVFYVLTGFWCYVGYWVSGRAAVGAVFKAYGHLLVPLVLIGLGVYVLVANGTYVLFGLG